MNVTKALQDKTVEEREDEGVELHVRDEAGEKLYADTPSGKIPVVITVAGTYSKTYRRAAEANRDRAAKSRRMDGDAMERQGLELVAKCILGWKGFFTDDACTQLYALTKQNAIALLQGAPWIREQVEAAMMDHASFLRTAG